MTAVTVTRTYLELRGRDDLRRARGPVERVELAPRRPIGASEYLALYRLVGDRWHWRDRLAWPEDRLARHLGSPDVHVWVLTVHHETAGYFELQAHDADVVEILYFGLAPRFIGRGLGGWLLTRAVEECFALGAARVALNTCTLDGPHALPNYLARGFRIVRDEQYTVALAPHRDSAP